jgi:adenylate kinase
MGVPWRERAVVVKIDVPVARILERLSGRRWCPGCQATFHVKSSPPRQDGICDRCGRELIQREDDKESVVARRLHEYDERTHPVTRYYEDRGAVHRIDGERPADEVFADIRRVVEAVRIAGHA